MSAAALLDKLKDAGVHFTREGEDLNVRSNPGVSIGPYLERIQQNKPALIKELLRAEILEAAARVGPDFDPEHYVTVWLRYYIISGHSPTTAARIYAHLAEFTPREMEPLRRDAAATDDDASWVVIDRAALARFSNEFSPTLGVTA